MTKFEVQEKHFETRYAKTYMIKIISIVFLPICNYHIVHFLFYLHCSLVENQIGNVSLRSTIVGFWNPQ